MRTVDEWKAWWLDKRSALWPDDPQFYRVCARELKILFGDESPTRVLEIGCGDGTMFEMLAFDRAQYKGVDLSPRLLSIFKSRYPSVPLECCDGSSYVDHGNKYDLIFSNGLIQYFDRAMLESHFACVRSMMHTDSLFVCGSIPWRLHRSNYDSGKLTRNTEGHSILKLAKSKLGRALVGDAMGYWYEPHEVAALAGRHGFSFEFYGSMIFLYRFHAVMRVK